MDLIEKLKEKNIVCVRLKHEEEAMCERASVAYAAAALGLKGITGTLGSGGGSTQFVHHGFAYKADKAGFRGGVTEMTKAALSGGDPLEALKTWRTDVMEPDVHSTLRSFWEEGGQQGAKKRLTGKVVCISACFYAASYKGVNMGNKDGEASSRGHNA